MSRSGQIPLIWVETSPGPALAASPSLPEAGSHLECVPGQAGLSRVLHPLPWKCMARKATCTTCCVCLRPPLIMSWGNDNIQPADTMEWVSKISRNLFCYRKKTLLPTPWPKHATHTDDFLKGCTEDEGKKNRASPGSETLSTALCLFDYYYISRKEFRGLEGGRAGLPPLDNALPYQGRLLSGFLSQAPVRLL